jgi:hypothetical protein
MCLGVLACVRTWALARGPSKASRHLSLHAPVQKSRRKGKSVRFKSDMVEAVETENVRRCIKHSYTLKAL